jgi:hypothetical protein
VQVAHDVGEQEGHGDDHHDHAGLARRAEQDLLHVAPAPDAVDAHHQGQGAGGAHPRHFRGRAPAVVEGDHHHGDQHDEGQQARQRLEPLAPGEKLGLEQFARRAALARRLLLARGGEHHPQGEDRGEQDAGDDAGDEQLADRLLGDDAVDDQRQRGRDEDAQRAAGGDEAGGQFLRVAALPHLRDAHAAHGGAGGRAGAAHGGEHRAAEDVGHAEAAGQLVEPAMRRLVEVRRRPRLADRRAHQDEQRDGEQGEVVQLAVERLGDVLQVARRHEEEHEAERHAAQREGDRHAGEQQQQRRAEVEQADLKHAHGGLR